MDAQKKPLPRFKLSDLKQYKKDGFLAIDGYVYNMTGFLDEHPGGRDYIIEHSGGDASNIFKSDEIHAHSAIARDMLKQYRIGVIEGQNETKLDPETKPLADFSKAVAPQVLRMGEEYQWWVHHTAAPKGFRLFESNFFESFSHYPWWYIFFMWIPIILRTFYLSLQHGLTVPLALAMFPCGALFWTMLEYTLHRFVFHMDSRTGWANWFHFFAHGIHHLTPTDPTRLAFPPVFAVFVGSAMYYAIIGLGGKTFGHALFAGGAFAYMMYDAMHYFFHHGESWTPFLPWPIGPYFRWMKSRHLDHHFKNENRNYGVTAPIWDVVFGTSG